MVTLIRTFRNGAFDLSRTQPLGTMAHNGRDLSFSPVPPIHISDDPFFKFAWSSSGCSPHRGDFGLPRPKNQQQTSLLTANPLQL